MRSLIKQTNKQQILIILGDCNPEIGANTQENWNNFCGQSCNTTVNERFLRLLQIASYNNLSITNTLWNHEASRTWMWHAHERPLLQRGRIPVNSWFLSGINKTKPIAFLGAGINSYLDVVVVNFRIQLRSIKKTKNGRLRVYLENLKDLIIVEEFRAIFGGMFTPLLMMETDIEALINNFIFL